jgi:hypothetical protein
VNWILDCKAKLCLAMLDVAFSFGIVSNSAEQVPRILCCCKDGCVMYKKKGEFVSVSCPSLARSDVGDIVGLGIDNQKEVFVTKNGLRLRLNGVIRVLMKSGVAAALSSCRPVVVEFENHMFDYRLAK